MSLLRMIEQEKFFLISANRKTEQKYHSTHTKFLSLYFTHRYTGDTFGIGNEAYSQYYDVAKCYMAMNTQYR